MYLGAKTKKIHTKLLRFRLKMDKTEEKPGNFQ